MSQSPAEVGEDAEAYHTGWAAISRLLRRGFSWSGHERDVVFSNQGDWSRGRGSFVDVSAPSGLDFDQDGRAAVALDWDFDGDLDLCVSARNGPRVRVLRNDQREQNHWLALRLVGAMSNSDAIGARVEVQLAGSERRLVATRRAGEGFLAQGGSWLHLGLGAGEPEGLRVRWPGGEWEPFEGVRRDRFLILVQGSGKARTWPAPSAATPLEGGGPLTASGVAKSTRRVVLRDPLPMPTLAARTGAGTTPRSVRFFGIQPGARGRGTGRALLLTLFSRTCAPCGRELAALAEAAPELAAAGLDRVALSVDPPEEAQAVADFVARTRFTTGDAPGTVGSATPETMATLDAIVAALLDRDERLAVPASFLIDANGLLQVFYLGPVRPEQVKADLRLAGLEAGRLRELAAQAFPGRLLTDPSRDPLEELGWFEAAMRRRGLPGVAQELEVGRIDAQALDEAKLQLEFGKARLGQERLDAARRHFEACLKLDPTRAEAWQGLGYCLHRAGELESARDAYRQALRYDPKDDRTLINLGLVLRALGDEAGVEEVRERLEVGHSPLLSEFERLLGG